jgi:hypothetical protein
VFSGYCLRDTEVPTCAFFFSVSLWQFPLPDYSVGDNSSTVCCYYISGLNCDVWGTELRLKSNCKSELSTVRSLVFDAGMRAYSVNLWPRVRQSLQISNCAQSVKVGRDSVGGIATCYGLDGPGIESRRGWDFPYPSIPSLGPIQQPVQRVPGVFPGSKAAGAWCQQPTPF